MESTNFVIERNPKDSRFYPVESNYTIYFKPNKPLHTFKGANDIDQAIKWFRDTFHPNKEELKTEALSLLERFKEEVSK